MIGSKNGFTIGKILLTLIILLLPYDAVKFLPTVYRPLSLIPLVLLAVFLIPTYLSSRFDKSSQAFLVFYLFSVTISLLLLACNLLGVNFFLGDFITLSIGVVLFLSCNVIFKALAERLGPQKYKEWFVERIAYAYYLPLIISLLDAMSVFHILPSGVSQAIHGVFGGWQDRVCGVTSEASWLVMHMALCGSAYLYLYLLRRKKTHLICALLSLVLIVLSVSLNGYIIVLLAVVIYWIYECKHKHGLLFWILPIIAVTSIAFLFIVMNSIDSDAYFIQRFKIGSLSSLYRNDISVFLRVTNPLLGIAMGVIGVIGVGLGGYAQHYGRYINRHFPWVLGVYKGKNEVVATIKAGTANSKNLFANAIACSGWFSVFFFAGVVSCYKKLRGHRDLVFMAAVMICCTLQFDSLCFFLWFVFLAFANNLRPVAKTAKADKIGQRAGAVAEVGCR